LRILTIGCGYIGSVLAGHLADRLQTVEIVISDRSKETIEKAASHIDKDNVYSLRLDFSDYHKLVDTIKKFDITIGLTPGRLGYQTVKAAIEACVDMVDLSYMPEDPTRLHDEAKSVEVTVIPDCGVAPGLSNILVGRAVGMLDSVEDVYILVGGLPQKRVPPLDYKITWCVEDLIEEYVRKAMIVKEGKRIEVEALEGLEEIDFPGVGELEAFFTDGVRTLHHTVKGVENMWEKTLRYSGHAEKIRLLKELGLFDEEPVLQGVSPRSLTAKLLEQKLGMPEVKDLLALKIEVNGVRKGSGTRYNCYLLDYYDVNKKVTAMGRTTAYTASAVVQLLAKGDIKEKGVVPPERLGMNKKIFNRIMAELGKDGIKVGEKMSKL
jgi:saccharopine dehydrogenase-like NADP-dependent oxidoreductase